MRFIRWWQSKINLIQIWSLVELALPILLLTDFGTLGFSAKTAAWIMIIVKMVNVIATIAARNTSTTLVADKATVEAQK